MDRSSEQYWCAVFIGPFLATKESEAIFGYWNAARPAFLACAKEGVFKRDESNDSSTFMYLEEFTQTLVVAMFNTLLGMDANDPPKTLATMELFSSILCNVSPRDLASCVL